MPKARKLRSPKLNTKGIYVQQPIRHLGMLKELGGSCSDDFNETLISQAFDTMWQGGCDAKGMELKNGAMFATMFGMRPRDEIEGMLTVQIFGVHNALMECLHQAMHVGQTFAGRHWNLERANELVASFVMLVEALGRYRVKTAPAARDATPVH
jgi:hypothetical protein